MSIRCVLVMIIAFSFPVRQSFAQDMPEHVIATLNKVVGKWTMERIVDGKKFDSEIELEWSIPNTTILFKWRGTDSMTGKPAASVGILGWDPIKQLVVEHEIGSGGFTADSTHIITSDGKWVSPSSGTSVINGKAVFHQEHRIIKMVSIDEWTVSGIDRVVDGKPQAEPQADDVARFRRRK